MKCGDMLMGIVFVNDCSVVDLCIWNKLVVNGRLCRG